MAQELAPLRVVTRRTFSDILYPIAQHFSRLKEFRHYGLPAL